MKAAIAERLRFYFITDDAPYSPCFYRQVEIALAAGATMVQYRSKQFSLEDFETVVALRGLCRRHFVSFLVNDDVVLAKAVAADGVHLGQADAGPQQARMVLGPQAIIGVSVSTPEELATTDLSACDYIGTGPVYATGTKADANPVIGLSGLQAVAEKAPVPAVAIGGITPGNIGDCMRSGAAGGAVISCITRSGDPQQAAREFGRASGALPRKLQPAWQDEFSLIGTFLARFPADAARIRVPPGDDAALLHPAANPVVTTDAQREGVHFRTDWQSMEEIGQKAVEIAFSDLAASYASPRALFVNIGLPACMAEQSVESLYQGIEASLCRHGAVLGGGNVSEAPEFSLDLFALGEGEDEIFPLRSRARPGDGVYVTGPVGLARAGLLCLERWETDFDKLIRRFKFPAARFDAARILAEEGVSCVIDISDGLSGDAAHLARASGVSIVFEPGGLPVAPELAEFCSRTGASAQELMFAGGEDYELLFTCPHEVFSRIRQKLPGAFRAGRCEPYCDALVKNVPPGAVSYQHGRG
ncbi:MAG: thiamine-phosphate kinase [Desulfosalsimonadaceae bacterium]